jgi:transcriptional regulator with AAA-type ATPase domain
MATQSEADLENRLRFIERNFGFDNIRATHQNRTQYSRRRHESEILHRTEPLHPGIVVAPGSHQKRDSEVKLLRAGAELPEADAVVIVMGPTGAGKSRFIREVTGEDVEVGDSLESGK